MALHDDAHVRGQLGNLIAAAQSGSESASNELCRYLEPFIRLLVRRRMREENEVAEIVQETTIRLLRYLPRIDASMPDHCLRAYLAQIANSCVSEFHRQRRRSFCVALPEELQAGDSAEHGNLETEELHSVMEILPARTREALRLRFFEDMTYSQIAARLGGSVGAAHRLVSAGLAALRHRLAAEAG